MNTQIQTQQPAFLPDYGGVLFGLRSIDGKAWMFLPNEENRRVVLCCQTREQAERWLSETCKPLANELVEIAQFLPGEYTVAVSLANRADQEDEARMSTFPFGDLKSFYEAAKDAEAKVLPVQPKRRKRYRTTLGHTLTSLLCVIGFAASWMENTWWSGFTGCLCLAGAIYEGIRLHKAMEHNEQ